MSCRLSFDALVVFQGRCHFFFGCSTPSNEQLWVSECKIEEEKTQKMASGSNPLFCLWWK